MTTFTADTYVSDYTGEDIHAVSVTDDGATFHPEILDEFESRRAAANIARWLTEIGVTAKSLTRLKRRGFELLVWTDCGRCNGSGRLWWTHVEGGVCFGCYGKGGCYVEASKLAGRIRRRAARKAKLQAEALAAVVTAAKRRRQVAGSARLFLKANPEVLPALRKAQGDFLRSLSKQLAEKGFLSERQVTALVRIAAEKAAQAERREIDVPEGRQEIEGTIRSLKDVEGDWGTTLKALVEVETPEGSYRVWGTVPQSLIVKARPGSRVRFTATLTPKELGFGFYKRPAKAELVFGEEV